MDNIDEMELSDLKKLKKKIDKAIETFETRRKSEALEALQASAKELGFDLSELVGGVRVPKLRSPVAPKYANPLDESETWSGRGRKPSWFNAAIESGKSPEDMEI